MSVPSGSTSTSLGPLLYPGGPAILTGTANFGNKACACCGKTQSTLYCEGCKITDIGQSRIFYCSKTCRKSHREYHERTCIQRQKVARAASIVKVLWEEFASTLFDTPLKFVKRQDRVIRMQRKYGICDPRAYTGKSMYERFPEDVFPTKKTKEDAVQAVLHDSGCQEILVSGLPLIKALISPIVFIQEVSVEIKAAALVVRVDGEMPKTTDHTVLKLSLADGSTLALDFSGGQYGWQEILYDWGVYQNHRIGRVDSVHALGFSRDVTNSVMKQMGFVDASPEQASFNNRRDAMRTLTTKLKKHLDSRKMNIPALLSLNETEFHSVHESLIVEAKKTIQEYLQSLQTKGIGRLFWDNEFRLRVTTTREEAAALEDVWLSKEDMVGPEAMLRRRWKHKVAARDEKEKCARKAEIARFEEE